MNIHQHTAELARLWNVNFGAWRKFWSGQFLAASKKPNLAACVGLGVVVGAFLLGAWLF